MPGIKDAIPKKKIFGSNNENNTTNNTALIKELWISLMDCKYILFFMYGALLNTVAAVLKIKFAKINENNIFTSVTKLSEIFIRCSNCQIQIIDKNENTTDNNKSP